MSTYLELCQKVARKSGTLSGTVPTTIFGQTGRLAKIVDWVDDAWQEIQNDEDTWLWMRKEWSGSLILSTARYTPASFSITNHAKWLTHPGALWLYDTDVGLSDEYMLRFITWDAWRQMYGRGAQTDDKPVDYTVSPAGELCFGPIPDKTYAVRGDYQQTVQALEANDDTPLMPARFHRAIQYKALTYLFDHDEAWNQYATTEKNLRGIMRDLRRDQLPQITIESDPIA